MYKCLAALALAACLSLPAAAADIVSSVDAAALSKSRQTDAGLYLTSRDAHAALEAEPGIVFIDVRTQAEFSYVGHADSVDQNIPFRFLSNRFDAKSGSYEYDKNENFVADVMALMAREGKGKDDPVFVMCRSGGRSAGAVNALAAAGFTRVYNIIDGFEGGTDKATGHRTVEGWRHEDLPWSYGISEAAAYRPKG